MRLDLGLSFAEREADKEKWHLWFAWYPVRVWRHDCRWLEYVERRGVQCGYGEGCHLEWQYKVLTKIQKEG